MPTSALLLVALAALPWGLVAVIGPPPAPWLFGLALQTAVILALGAWIVVLMGRERRAHQRRAREIARLSLTDPLTGLGNRNALERDLEPIVCRARRATAPLALLRMDVGGLGRLNERYGQARGDETLKHLGAVLRSTLRFGTDSAYRVGGDEFVAVLAADAPAAKAVASRVARTFTERSPLGLHLEAKVIAWDGESKPFELLRDAVAASPGN